MKSMLKYVIVLLVCMRNINYLKKGAAKTFPLMHLIKHLVIRFNQRYERVARFFFINKFQLRLKYSYGELLKRFNDKKVYNTKGLVQVFCLKYIIIRYFKTINCTVMNE